MSRPVVLLGAGATMPTIPGVWDITKHLRKWDLFRAPDPSSPSGLVSSGTADARPPLFEYLTHCFAGYWANEPQFEQLMHVLELLDSLYPLPKNAGVKDQYRPMLAPFISPLAPYDQNDGYGYAVQHSCAEVLSVFSAACDRVSTTGHPLSSMFAALAKECEFDIFSLNYDDVPEHSGISFETGYDPGNPFDFSPLRLQLPRKYGHFQMHGSVLFGNPDLMDVVPRYVDRATARSNRVSFGSGNDLQDGHHSPALPMITGMRKADKVLYEPYASYASAFRGALLESTTWLIIGYGAGDHHINSALASARRAHLQAGNRLKVIVVDYHDFRGLANAEIEVGYPLGTRLLNLFRWAPDVLRAIQHAPGLPSVRAGAFNQLIPEFWASFDGVSFAANGGYANLLSIIR